MKFPNHLKLQIIHVILLDGISLLVFQNQSTACNETRLNRNGSRVVPKMESFRASLSEHSFSTSHDFSFGTVTDFNFPSNTFRTHLKFSWGFLAIRIYGVDLFISCGKSVL